MKSCESYQGRSGLPVGQKCQNLSTHRVSAQGRPQTLNLCQQCASAYQQYPNEFTVNKNKK